MNTKIQVIEAWSGGDDVLALISDPGGELRSALARSGAVLLRGFRSASVGPCADVIARLGLEPVTDVFHSTPRQRVDDHTVTTTEYPSDREIPLHCELAYMRVYPRLMCFYAVACPEQGGETSLAPLDEMSEGVRPIVDEFAARGVRYTRVFRPGIDVPIEHAFQASGREDIERTASRYDMRVEWLPSGAVRVWHTGRGALRDPNRGTYRWFNQAQIYHASSIGADARRMLVECFGEDSLPRHAAFADGAMIPDEMLADVRRAFEAHALNHSWQTGDVLLLDNTRWAHGRRRFVGRRRIHVAMGGADSSDVCSELPFP